MKRPIKIKCSIRLYPEIYAMVKELSEKHKVTKTQVIESAIFEFYKKMK